MQEATLAPGSVPNHIIMDENMADFLIIGGGIAGNLLANRIHNSLSCLSMDVNFGQWFNDRKISKFLNPWFHFVTHALIWILKSHFEKIMSCLGYITIIKERIVLYDVSRGGLSTLPESQS